MTDWRTDLNEALAATENLKPEEMNNARSDSANALALLRLCAIQATGEVERLQRECSAMDEELSWLRYGNKVYEGDVNRLDRQLAEARAAGLHLSGVIREYANHRGGCAKSSDPTKPCNCGLEKALAAQHQESDDG